MDGKTLNLCQDDSRIAVIAILRKSTNIYEYFREFLQLEFHYQRSLTKIAPTQFRVGAIFVKELEEIR